MYDYEHNPEDPDKTALTRGKSLQIIGSGSTASKTDGTRPKIFHERVRVDKKALNSGRSASPSEADTPSMVETPWVAYIDEGTRVRYYYNSVTGETTWEPPENYVEDEGNLQFTSRQSSSLSLLSRQNSALHLPGQDPNPKSHIQGAASLLEPTLGESSSRLDAKREREPEPGLQVLSKPTPTPNRKPAEQPQHGSPALAKGSALLPASIYDYGFSGPNQKKVKAKELLSKSAEAIEKAMGKAAALGKRLKKQRELVQALTKASDAMRELLEKEAEAGLKRNARNKHKDDVCNVQLCIIA